MPSQANRSALHEAARSWASAGFAVFPCTPQAKTPATPNGLHDATTSLDQIDRWWTANPAYNIGIAPERSGMFVLDVDPPLGAKTLAALEADNGALPPTLTITTPRGGLHYWFAGSCPSTVGTLGAKLDTRGVGGYVLVPPSVVNGKEYDYASDTNDIADGPNWIATTLANARQRQAAREDVVADLPCNVARATALLRHYVENGDIAVEGAGGDSRTYQVACEILNLGLSPERAFDLIRDEWNPHCIPPWDRDELSVKVHNAAEYAQNEPGAWAAAPPADTFAHIIAAGHVGEPVKRSKFWPRDEAEQDTRPEPRWLIDSLLPAESTVMLYGPPGSFKSFLALDLSLTLASGIAGFGVGERPPQDVVYVVAEGASGVERNRRPAWREAKEVAGLLNFFTVDSMPSVARPQEMIELVEAIKGRGINPALVVIDTLARAMAGKNENDARDAGEFIEALEMLKRALGATILAIHHTGKDEGRGGRGSSAFLAGFDTAIEVIAREATKAVAMHVRRHKDAEIPRLPWTFEGQSVAKSLVFFPTDTETHRRLTKGDDAFGPVKIGAVLRELHAVGEAAAVTTQVLASHMVPQMPNETAEERNTAVGRASRQLTAFSKGRLEAYTVPSGRGIKWCLPPTNDF